jgi:TATA-box binding protein (TBP) (component of TFIID and TFIIIB)
VVNNIVVGFDLGASLNLEQMLRSHPEKVERDYVLPMLTYFYSGERRMRAFLFRTGRGLMPGVRSVNEVAAMFPEIYRDTRPFLYSGDNVLESTEIVNVTGMLQENADLEDMLMYLEMERPDMVSDNSALSTEFQKLLRDLDDLDA